MKLKLLATIAISLVFAASNVLASPYVKVADETAAPADTLQTPSLDNNTVSPMPTTTPGNDTQAQANVGSLSNNLPSQSPTQLSENNNSSPDEMTADAATGEDDF